MRILVNHLAMKYKADFQFLTLKYSHSSQNICEDDRQHHQESRDPAGVKPSARLHHRDGFVWFAPSIDCNVTIPVAISLIFTTGYFLCTGGGSHTPMLEYLNMSRRFRIFLPFEWFAVSPPLYFWGAPMKTPPTFCHMGNKRAAFILIFIISSAAFYLVT